MRLPRALAWGRAVALADSKESGVLAMCAFAAGIDRSELVIGHEPRVARTRVNVNVLL
ncbi:hypothetical protein RHOER0001_0844 [Rhodococcus erythropolis SK121]|nr:hypothetical protein RHOER0001_0844 [Rhodococcus erythropolis SK121]